jgi:hypothetical protein
MRPFIQIQHFMLRVRCTFRLLIILCLVYTVSGARSQNITGLWYWLDANGEGSAVHVSVTPSQDLTVDFSLPENISPGLHLLNIKAQDDGSHWSQTSRYPFCYMRFENPQVINLEYFLDTDPGTGMGTPVSFTPGTNVTDIVIPLNLYNISRGIHHLFIRGQDENGSWSMTGDRVILCEPVLQNIVAAEYFFETDPGTGLGTSVTFVHDVNVTNLVFNLDLNAIPKGIHHFFIRAKDEFGRWSLTNDKVVICEPGTLPDIVQAEYFIDTDPGSGMGTNVPVTPANNIDNLVFMIDMTPLTAGNHNLFLRAKDSYGKWSLTNMAQFEVIHLMHNLNLIVFLEGLYAGNALMVQANDENGPHFGGDIADQVTVELHNAANYSDIVYSSGPADLRTGGQVNITGIPANISGSYYITIRHRNSIETTTAGPVSFSGTNISYDFSTSASQAFGDNQREIGGIFAIWGGDVNQDGIVDGGDMNPVDNASTAITFGYVPEDVNGDGIVDGGDMNTVDNNSTAIIMALIP